MARTSCSRRSSRTSSGPIIVEFTVRLGYAIFTVATLSPSSASAPTRRSPTGDRTSPSYTSSSAPASGGPVLFPALAIATLIVGINLIADAIAQPSSDDDTAIELQDLQSSTRVRGVDRRVLRGVDLSIGQGESYGLVGESGCGKTTAAFAIMRSLPRNGRVVGGSIRVNGEDMPRMSGGEVRRLRATDALDGVPEPRLGVEPVDPGRAAGRPRRSSFSTSRRRRRRRGREAMLAKVQISDPERVMRRYPHQLSGGMQQRVVIAMALAKRPDAPHPRRADHRTRRDRRGRGARPRRRRCARSSDERPLHQPQPRRSSRRCASESASSTPAGSSRRGRTQEVFRDPRHPYTVGLLRCIPRGGRAQGRDGARHDPGLPSPPRRRPARLRLRAALRARKGGLPAAGAGAHRARQRTRQPLSLPRPRARTAARRPRRGCGRAEGERQAVSSRPSTRSKTFKPGRPGRPCARRHLARRATRARCSAWSANRAAARPPSPAFFSA